MNQNKTIMNQNKSKQVKSNQNKTKCQVSSHCVEISASVKRRKIDVCTASSPAIEIKLKHPNDFLALDPKMSREIHFLLDQDIKIFVLEKIDTNQLHLFDFKTMISHNINKDTQRSMRFKNKSVKLVDAASNVIVVQRQSADVCGPAFHETAWMCGATATMKLLQIRERSLDDSVLVKQM